MRLSLAMVHPTFSSCLLLTWGSLGALEKGVRSGLVFSLPSRVCERDPMLLCDILAVLLVWNSFLVPIFRGTVLCPRCGRPQFRKDLSLWKLSTSSVVHKPKSPYFQLFYRWSLCPEWLWIMKMWCSPWCLSLVPGILPRSSVTSGGCRIFALSFWNGYFYFSIEFHDIRSEGKSILVLSWQLWSSHVRSASQFLLSLVNRNLNRELLKSNVELVCNESAYDFDVTLGSLDQMLIFTCRLHKQILLEWCKKRLRTFLSRRYFSSISNTNSIPSSWVLSHIRSTIYHQYCIFVPLQIGILWSDHGDWNEEDKNPVHILSDDHENMIHTSVSTDIFRYLKNLIFFFMCYEFRFRWILKLFILEKTKNIKDVFFSRKFMKNT